MLRNHYTTKLPLCLACVLIVVFITTGVAASPVEPSDQKPMLYQAMKVQVPFAANEGQVRDKTVKYYTWIFGGSAYVTDNGEMNYSFPAAILDHTAADDYALRHLKRKPPSIKETLVGASI
jgi:hypothetical protein